MGSEVDERTSLWRQISQNASASESELPLSLAQAWVSAGGVAANGIKYASSSNAVAWGNKGCPLLPRDVREYHRGVKLPHDLQKLFGVPLTVDQLNSSVLERLENDTAWQPTPIEFRDFLYNMPILAAQVAIPAGIPLVWIEELPIKSRTRGAVRWVFSEAGADGFLRVPMLAREFLAIRSVGVTFLNELTCVIESAELGWTDEDPTVDLDAAGLQQEAVQRALLIDSAALEIVEGMSSFNRYLREFARWSMAETDAQTFGEAIAELIRAGSANDVLEASSFSQLSGTGSASPASIPGARQVDGTDRCSIEGHLHG